MRRSLAFRIFVPFFAALLLLGAGLYVFVLRSTSRFAEENIREMLSEMSHDIYFLCESNHNDAVDSGSPQYDPAIRKKRTIGLIEEFAVRNTIEVHIAEGNVALMNTDGFPPDLVSDIEAIVPEHTISPFSSRLDRYYASHVYFAPWDWHILVLKDTDSFSELLFRVRSAYAITAALLIVLALYFTWLLHRTIRVPLGRIIDPLRKDTYPVYRGIREFEYLSDTIRSMMESLKQETRILNTIYQIAATKKGADFFAEVAEAIARMYEMNVLIAEINPDGRSERALALYMNGRLSQGMNIRLEGTPCEDVVEKKHLCVIEEGARGRYPDAGLLAETNAESFIGFAIFDRINKVIGVVNAFGAKRTFSEADVKVLQTIGTLVAAEMERLTDEREKDLLREQIFHVQKMEAIGTLAGGVAHDFNNILQGILGYASLLKMKTPEADPRYKQLAVIEQLGDKAAELTRHLLGFARKGKYIVQPFLLNEVVESVLTIISRTFDRAIDIQARLDPELWTAEMDKNQIEQVLLNICLNARDAMPAGGVLAITTRNLVIGEGDRTRPWLRPGHYVVVSITDTGVGMAEEVRNHIFEPFFTTKETGKGTGMGLAMVYGVIKNHDGYITVDSEPGKGSTFTLYFPRVERKPRIAEPETTSPAGGKGTILVVDDEDYILAVTRTMLSELGYTVIEAMSSPEAIHLFRTRHRTIDLVILDLIMPKMGGAEMFRKLREIDPVIPIVIATGQSMHSGTWDELMNEGAAGFIAKPFTKEEIAERVQAVLTSRQGAG